ncbi:MAG: hypothetical protein ACHQ5A_00390 [Opitutales bacterium]
MNNPWDRFAEHRGWKQLLCTGLVLLILLARVPHYWSGGEFVAEDGWVFFADAWNHPFPGVLFLPYAGYFHLLARLVAELWSGLPIAGQPYAFAATGLLLNAVILSAFYLPAFRGVVAPDLGRLAVVLLLALAPQAENLGLILGLHWYLAFGLTLLLLVPAPVSRGAGIAVSALILLCIWSSPATFVLVPFALAVCWRSPRRADRLQAALMCAAFLVVGVLIGLLRVEGAARTGTFQWPDLVLSLDRLVLRGWLGVGLLGPRIAGYLAGGFPLVLDLAALGVFAGGLVWLWRNRSQEFARPVTLVLGAALLMLLFSLTRTAYVAELARLALPRHGRYLTAPTLLLYVGLGIAASHARPGLRRGHVVALAGLLAALLIQALPGEIHWSRPAVWFHLRDAIPAVENLRAQHARDGRPASLYLPSDVPYWGPVLEVGGGQIVRAAVGVVQAVGATPDASGRYTSWLGRFARTGPDNWIDHEAWGRIEFTGIEKGRVFFRDAAGRLLFTSPLLYPRAWRLDGYEWSLLPPPAR